MNLVTFYSDFGLAEVTAGSVAGFAQVISCISHWHRSDLQGGCTTNKCDFGVVAGLQLPPVLHPLYGKRWGSFHVTFEAELVSLIYCHRFQRNIKFGSLGSFWKRDGRKAGLQRSSFQVTSWHFGPLVQFLIENMVTGVLNLMPKNWLQS